MSKYRVKCILRFCLDADRTNGYARHAEFYVRAAKTTRRSWLMP
jgi:hypothetical protein